MKEYWWWSCATIHYSDETELPETHTAQRHSIKILLRFTGLVTLVMAQHTMHNTIIYMCSLRKQYAESWRYELRSCTLWHAPLRYSIFLRHSHSGVLWSNKLLTPMPYGKWISMSFVDVQECLRSRCVRVLLLEWTWISTSPSSLILIQTPIANSASNFRTQYNTLLINYTTQQDPLHHQLYDHANTPMCHDAAKKWRACACLQVAFFVGNSYCANSCI